AARQARGGAKGLRGRDRPPPALLQAALVARGMVLLQRPPRRGDAGVPRDDPMRARPRNRLREPRGTAGAGWRIRPGARHAAARAQRGSSVDPMIPANLATLLPKLGEPDTARIMLADALAADSLNAMVQYCAALTCWQLGERDRALDWLTRAVAGGYPLVWLRDSPVHREWRGNPRFDSLLAGAPSKSGTAPSPGK